MKKTMIGVLLALMLVISVVPALAERGSDDGIALRTETGLRLGVGINSSNNSAQRMMLEEEREEFKEQREAAREEFKERSQNLREAIKQTREVAREEMKNALEQIKEDRERLKELQREYKGKRDDVKQSREDYARACKGKVNTTECREAREEFKDDSKQFVGNAADQMLTVIATMKTRVTTNANIDNETAAKIVAQLDARAAAITAAQAKVNASTDLNSTQAAAAELRTTWQEARVTIRLTEGLLAHARFQAFLDRLNSMDEKLINASAELKAEGKNTTQLDADLAAFGTQIDVATASYVSARDSYIDAMASADTEAEANTLLKATKEQLKTAQDDLKAARTSLRAVIKDFAALSPEKLASVAAQVSLENKNKENVEDSEDDA